MPRVCALNIDWVQTVPKRTIEDFITHLPEERVNEVFEAIKFAFGFEK